MTTPACRSPTGSICRRAGQTTPIDAPRPASRRMSSSAPKRRSPLTRFEQRWPPGMQPLPPKAWSGRGRPPSLVRRHPAHKPTSATELAQALPVEAWHGVTWREGTHAPLTSRFAAVRVRPAHRDYWRSAPRPEEWCLIEWPEGASEPTKYWLSTLPQETRLADLVDQAKLRWRIERDYQ